MNSPYEPFFAHIRRLGRQNLDAIKTHHDIKAGKRGISGPHQKKTEIRGIACPKRKVVRYQEPPPLPRIRVVGRPLACTGPKPTGDGYKRDRITGVITRRKTAHLTSPVKGADAQE